MIPYHCMATRSCASEGAGHFVLLRRVCVCQRPSHNSACTFKSTCSSPRILPSLMTKKLADAAFDVGKKRQKIESGQAVPVGAPATTLLEIAC